MSTLQRFAHGLLNLSKILTRYEKIVLIGLLALIIATSGLWYQSFTAHWTVQPVKGGTYAEGIASTESTDIDQVIAKLTKIGLTYIDHENTIKGALAERWEVTEDGKVYTFHLHPSVDAKRIADEYISSPGWQNITIETGENNTLIMRLKQPFSLLLSFTSDPIISQGPFIIEKQTNNEIVLTANPDFVLGEPNLQRLVLSFYQDDRSLKAALQRQEIMGADRAIDQIGGTRIRKLQLTKQDVLLFNLEREVFKDKTLREKVIKNQKLDKPLSVTLATSQEPDHLEIANDFAKRAKKLNLNVSIKSLNEIALARDVLATDDYDLLVTTFNYGYDEDPYPYWHSSQIIEPGKNYAGYNSKEADKLIEQSRQSLDEVTRQQKLKEFWDILAKDNVAIFYPKQVFKYTVSDRLKGQSEGIGAVPADRYAEVWKWYLKAKKQKSSES